MCAAVKQQQNIPFNKAIFKWARERRGRSYEQAANSAGVAVEKIIEWENVKVAVVPTVKQARALANEYARPFLEFFSPSIPEVQENKLIPDFRMHRAILPAEESLGLLDIQSWAETQRLNTLDLLEILGDQTPRFPNDAYATLETSPSDAARRVRGISNFSYSEQIGLKSNERDKVPKRLRARIEAMGVLVLKTSSLQKFKARGICIYSPAVPIIVFGNEASSAQSFTLAHELAHIVLRQSALSGPPPSKENSSRVERWCNEFAAAFLIPSDLLAIDMQGRSKQSQISDEHLRKLAARYSVSRHAMLIRLISLGYVDADYYWAVKRSQFLQEEEDYKGGGRSAYYGSRYRNAVGDYYTRLVLEAWETGKISNHNAGEFMGIKNLNHLDDIRSHFSD